MARTMKWPPAPVGGRIPMVEGIEATNILVVQTLGDLQANPFNQDGLSLGQVAFKSQQVALGRIGNALERLKRIISVESIAESTDRSDAEDGSRVYVVSFMDRETRVRSEATVNG